MPPPSPSALMARFMSGQGQKLYAINGKTGVKLWEFETGSFVSSSLAIGSDSTVYVGSSDNKLYAINGKTGSSYGNLKREVLRVPPPPSALMARFMSGQ